MLSFCCLYASCIHCRSTLYMWLCNRWFTFRGQMTGALVSGLIAVVVVYQAGYYNTDNSNSNEGNRSGFNATLAGLALLYTSSFTENLTYTIRVHAKCQMNMNSVERIIEYNS